VSAVDHRFFILYETHIDYYENPKTDAKPKGTIELGTCSVTPIKVRAKVSKVISYFMVTSVTTVTCWLTGGVAYPCSPVWSSSWRIASGTSSLIRRVRTALGTRLSATAYVRLVIDAWSSALTSRYSRCACRDVLCSDIVLYQAV